MIDQKVLDGLKLVDADNIATIPGAEMVIERAIGQGSQSWGVSDQDAVILRLAVELQAAQANTSETEELSNKIKGLQLEGGRLKKRIVVLEGIEALSKRQADEITALGEVIVTLTQQVSEAESAAAAAIGG